MSNKDLSRRKFLEFLGVSLGGALASPAILSLSGCSTIGKSSSADRFNSLPFRPLSTSFNDRLEVAAGFDAKILLSQGDVLSKSSGIHFGSHCDFLAFFPIVEGRPRNYHQGYGPREMQTLEAILWVNHEYYHPIQLHGKWFDEKRTASEFQMETKAVGGSIVRLKRDTLHDAWKMVANHPQNRRIDANTVIPFSRGETLGGQKFAKGMFGNCAGGVTPWSTVLTCEENFHDYVGNWVYKDGKRERKFSAYQYRWEEYEPQRDPDQYGWVVEVNLLNGTAKKHTSMGRFCHEGATLVPLKDGRVVVYLGDDSNDQCLYKFVSKKPESLEEGTLYVANLEKGSWVPLVWKDQPVLRENFKSQLEVMIRCREAAALLGGTPLDRPEDIEIHPGNGAVYVALTNNLPKNRPMGSLLKLVEAGGDHEAARFESSTFILGGEDSGFACPDNLAFDRQGNLWMTSDIGGSNLHKGETKSFGNNSLFYIPMQGKLAGQAFRVANAPMDAEFTGPCFSADGRTLFLSLQHPGEMTKKGEPWRSLWPHGEGGPGAPIAGSGGICPLSSVIQISGESLEQLTQKI